MIQQTSLLAYEEVKIDLGDRQLLVYNKLKELEYANNLILSRFLDLPINSITPRVLELRKKGLVVADGVRKCPITKRASIFWRVVK